MALPAPSVKNSFKIVLLPLKAKMTHDWSIRISFRNPHIMTLIVIITYDEPK